MSKLSKEEANQQLAQMQHKIGLTIKEARDFARANGLYFRFDFSHDSEYRELNEWEAEELGLKEGDMYWVSSSTFC